MPKSKPTPAKPRRHDAQNEREDSPVSILLAIFAILVLVAVVVLIFVGCESLEKAKNTTASQLWATSYDPDSGELIVHTDQPTPLGKAVETGLSTLEWVLLGGAGGGGVLWGALKMLLAWKRSPEGKFLPVKEKSPVPLDAGTP